MQVTAVSWECIYIYICVIIYYIYIYMYRCDKFSSPGSLTVTWHHSLNAGGTKVSNHIQPPPRWPNISGSICSLDLWVVQIYLCQKIFNFDLYDFFSDKITVQIKMITSKYITMCPFGVPPTVASRWFFFGTAWGTVELRLYGHFQGHVGLCQAESRPIGWLIRLRYVVC